MGRQIKVDWSNEIRLLKVAGIKVHSPHSKINMPVWEVLLMHKGAEDRSKMEALLLAIKSVCGENLSKMAVERFVNNKVDSSEILYRNKVVQE